MIPISESLEALLVRQGLRGVGRESGRANEMTSAPVDGEEERQRRHSPTAGEETQPMRIQNARAEAPASDVVGQKAIDPSPAHGRPVLRLVHCSSRLRPVRYATGPSLMLILGGKR